MSAAPARFQAASGPFALDLQARRLRRDGEEVHLTPKQFDLLALLIEREGRALTRN